MKARHGLRFIFSHIDTLGFGGHIGEPVNGMWHVDRSCRMHSTCGMRKFVTNFKSRLT